MNWQTNFWTMQKRKILLRRDWGSLCYESLCSFLFLIFLFFFLNKKYKEPNNNSSRLLIHHLPAILKMIKCIRTRAQQYQVRVILPHIKLCHLQDVNHMANVSAIKSNLHQNSGCKHIKMPKHCILASKQEKMLQKSCIIKFQESVRKSKKLS